MEIDSLSEVIKTGTGYTIYKCTAVSEPTNMKISDTIKEVLSYMKTNEMGRIEDYFKSEAEDFIATAKASSFDKACSKFDLQKETVSDYVLNYMNTSLIRTANTSVSQIASAYQNENFLKTLFNLSTNEITVIGIDHGYGNIKTAHSCFKTGVAVYDKEPTFKNNLLIYDGKYYIIGEEHKEFKSDKMADEDYYVLTLAAIARELKVRNKTFATVHIAAGLPLTWVGEQKEEFKKYLLQNKFVDFSFRNVDYHIDFAGADIFPHGFAAVSDKLHCFKGTNMLADIGNGTMNVMYINECQPTEKKCFTEKYGTNQCFLAIRENIESLKAESTYVTDEDINSEKTNLAREHGLPLEMTIIRLTDVPTEISVNLTNPKSCDDAVAIAEGLGGAPQKFTAMQYELSADIRERVSDLPKLTWSSRVDDSVLLVCDTKKTSEYKNLDDIIKQNATYKQAMFMADQQLKQLRRKAVIVINDDRYKL